MTPAALANLILSLPGSKQQKAWTRGIAEAAEKVGGLHVLLYACLQKGMDELHDTGGIALPYSPTMKPKLARRVVQLNKALNFARQGGVADAIVGDFMDDVLDGEADLIYEGWDIRGQEVIKPAFVELVQRWRKEDGLEPLSREKVKTILSQDWSPRARRKRRAEVVVVRREGRARA